MSDDLENSTKWLFAISFATIISVSYTHLTLPTTSRV